MSSAKKTPTKKTPVKKAVAVKKTSATKKNVKFQIAAEPGSRVFVAGSFNDWNAEQKQLKEKNGVYTITLKLSPGKYEYKFIVNGVWCVDSECQDWSSNGFGSINSVVTVS